MGFWINFDGFFFSSHLLWKCVCVFWFDLIAILTYGSVIQFNATGIYIMHHTKFAMLFFFRLGIHTKFLQKYRITCEMPKQMGSHNKTNAKNTLIRLVILAIFYKYIYIFNADWAYLLNVCCILCNKCTALLQPESARKEVRQWRTNDGESHVGKKVFSLQKIFSLEIGWMIWLMKIRWKERFFEFLVLKAACEFFAEKLLLELIWGESREFKRVQWESKDINESLGWFQKGPKLNISKIWWNSSDWKKSGFE